MTERSYTELLKRTTLTSRYRYLALRGAIGDETFGHERYLNQRFYQSQEWRSVRDQVIIRDQGRDLGLEGHEIHASAFVHHMNPISRDDLLHFNDDIVNPEYLITVSHTTHNAIHFGDENLLPQPIVERTPDDTLLWRRGPA